MEEKKRGKLINFRPLVLLTVCFILGITCAYYAISKSLYVLFFFFIPIIAGMIFCLLYPFKDKKKVFLYILAFLILFSSGFLNVEIRYKVAKSVPVYNGEGDFTGRVVKSSTYSNGYFVEIEKCALNDEKLKGKTCVFIPVNKYEGQPEIGDMIFCKAEIFRCIEDGNHFERPLNGIYYRGKFHTKVSIINSKPHFFEYSLLKLKKFFYKNLTKDNAPFAIALITGDTTGLDEERLDVFRMAGIAHVFAVSGLHIGIFVTVFMFIAKKLKLKKWTTLFVVLIPAFLYCGLCGFRQSAMRAFIMAGVLILSTCLGFKNDGLSSASLSAFILLLINPMNLFNAGFKLSYLAVTSIFILAPVFKRALRGIGFLSEPVAISLSAQLGTLPVLTDMSGYMSIIAVFANIIFIPLVSFLYVFLLICTFFGIIEGAIFSVARVTMFLPNCLIYFSVNAVNFVNYSKFILPAYFGNLSLLWYIGLFAFSDVVNIKRLYKIIIFIVTLCISFIFLWKL